MHETLSYQIRITLAVTQAVFLLLLEVCKSSYEKENSVDGSMQREDALFEFMQGRLGSTLLCWFW